MYRTKILVKKSLEKMRRRHLEGHDLVRRMDRQGEVLIWCRDVFGICEAKSGTETNELFADQNRWAAKEYGKMLKTIQTFRRW